MSDNALKITAIRSCFAIICITILAIMAISYNLDGELLKFGIGAIGLLGGGEIFLEYWLGKKQVEAKNMSKVP